MTKTLNRGSRTASEFISPLDFLPSIAEDTSDMDAVAMRLSTVSYEDYIAMVQRGELI